MLGCKGLRNTFLFLLLLFASLYLPYDNYYKNNDDDKNNNDNNNCNNGNTALLKSKFYLHNTLLKMIFLT